MPLISPPASNANVRAAMKGNRAKDTKPELMVRRLLFRLGYRFRLHRRDLPGTPDLVFPSRRKAVFVHGCFWHQHKGCAWSQPPRSNSDYWSTKLERNVVRDVKVRRALSRMGWKSIAIWECMTRSPSQVERKLRRFLD